jgi:cytochrome c-type protein NapC
MVQWKFKSLAAAAGLAAVLAAPGARAAGIDWASVPGKDVVLYFPSISNWEWALTADDMSGATKFKQEGKSCAECHDGEEKAMGDHLISGKTRVFKDSQKPGIEPTPPAGKPGWITATVKFANDGTNLYVHLDVKDGNQPDLKQDGQFAEKVEVMFTAGKTVDIVRAGCYAACHDDMTGMKSAAGATRTHYLSASHAHITRQGGGDALKPDADLAKLKADGYFLEQWQAKLNPGAAAQAAGYSVLAKRDNSGAAITAEGTTGNGVTSVTLSRKLAGGNGTVDFVPGQIYHVGFAVHDGHAGGRFHYVSLEKSLALNGGAADFIAVKK